MRSLWNRIGQLVSGSRRGEERLPMAVDDVPAHPHHFFDKWSFYHGDADHVLRLLYRDQTPAPSGPGPSDPASPWTVEHALPRSVPGEGGTSTIYTHTYHAATEYSTTLGGWTVTASIDCE